MECHTNHLMDLKALVERAGDAVMAIYSTDFSVLEKNNKTPLTEADLAANAIIKQGLNTISNYPCLSEEDKQIDWQERQTWQRYWLIDPIDGTKEFIKKNDEFTINIALIESGKAIMSVVYAPALETLYYAAHNLGAWKQNAAGVQELSLKHLSKAKPKRALISRSHKSREADVLAEIYPDMEFIKMGSSLKLCAVADGQADMYLRLGPTSEWDTGAAQCIVESAGGHVLTSDLKTLQYNQKECVLNPAFIVTNQINSADSQLFQ